MPCGRDFCSCPGTSSRSSRPTSSAPASDNALPAFNQQREVFHSNAGINYDKILHQAEQEAEVILSDGGYNDTPFYKPDLHITLLYPHRPGPETSYYPGETNFRMAGLLIINKGDTADPKNGEQFLESCRRHNPEARVIQCRSAIHVEQAELIRGRRALVIEEGPTLTHGGMSYGAGWLATKQGEAAEIVDANPHAVGTLRATYKTYPNARKILPALGYGEPQIRELEATINATAADVVVEGTPIDFSRILKVNKPVAMRAVVGA